MGKQITTTKHSELPPVAHGVLVAIALATSYLFVSRAIDTGSLLEYALAIVFLVLSVKHLVRGLQLVRKKNEQ